MSWNAKPVRSPGEALVFHNGIGGKRKEARLRYLSRWMNRLKDLPKIRFNTSFDSNQSCAIANDHIEGTTPDAVVKFLLLILQEITEITESRGLSVCSVFSC